VLSGDKEAILLNEDAVIDTTKKVGFDKEERFHQRFKRKGLKEYL
jgi:hypothetical protein